MATALRREEARLTAVPEGPARDEALRDVLAPWLRPLALEDALCPECTDNQADRERGSLDLPPVGAGGRFEIARVVPGDDVPLITRLEPVSPPEAGAALRLTSGSYRLAWLRGPGDASCELDFDS